MQSISREIFLKIENWRLPSEMRWEHCCCCVFVFWFKYGLSFLLPIRLIQYVSLRYVCNKGARSIWDTPTRMSWLCPYFNERVWAAILNAPMPQAQFSWKVTNKQKHRGVANLLLAKKKELYPWRFTKMTKEPPLPWILLAGLSLSVLSNGIT